MQSINKLIVQAILKMNFELENELIPSLGSDEKLIWTGKPKAGLRFSSSDVFLIPFSLMWGGFAVIWESSVIASGAPFFFMIWGIPFVAVGCYMIFGRFFFDAARRAGTIYGLTKNRVIIKSGVFSKETKSLNINTISDISFTQNADGSGTITLGPVPFGISFMNNPSWPGRNQVPKLELIENVKFVYDQLISVQNKY